MIIKSIIGPVELLPLLLLALILGLPGILIITTGRYSYFKYMLIYLLALPIWNLVLPAYAYWHFDDFSWGKVREIKGGDMDHGQSSQDVFDPQEIPLLTWQQWSELIHSKFI